MAELNLINLTVLPLPVKRQLWADLQADAPHLADLLADPLLRELSTTFDCTTHLDRAQLPASAIRTLQQHARGDA